MTTQDNEIRPKYKSVKLEPKEIIILKDFIGKFPNRTVAAKALGIGNRTTLSNILRAGSGSEDSINSIRKVITEAKAA